MDRMSARYMGIKLGKTTSEIYGMWNQMGLVIKDKCGDWLLTELDRSIRGKLSKSNYIAVPIFEYDTIIEMIALKEKLDIPGI